MSQAPHPSDDLHLYEEVLLLALNDERGTLTFGVSLNTALGGAILAELLLEGRVETCKHGKRDEVAAVGRSATGDAILDDALELIRGSKKPRSPTTWVASLGGMKELHHRVAAGLVRRRILRADEGKVALFFKHRIYPERDASFERAILARVERAVFSATNEIDPRTTVLVALASATGLLRANFDKRKLADKQKRIESITQGDLAGDATKQAVQAAQTAMMVATIMPMMMATVIASSSS